MDKLRKYYDIFLALFIIFVVGLVLFFSSMYIHQAAGADSQESTSTAFQY